MEETFEGTFYFDSDKQDWCVHFIKPNKKEAIIKCNPKQISPNLPRNKDEKIEVKFETDKRYYSEVLNVRLITEEVIMNEGNMTKGDFHNPYNFVPAIPRDVSHPEFGDHEPSGHDRYISDKFSGKLTVKMIVETPLVVLDTARILLNSNDSKHKQFPVRIENGKPFINPTAVKGMLRSAYEAVTNSRLSVFTKHEDRLAFRAEVGEGLFVVPARIENEKVFLYTGTSGQPTNSGKPQDRQPMYAAWVRKYKWHGSYSTAKLNANHKQKVWAFINLWEKRRKFTFWNVVEIQPHSATPPIHKPNENRVSEIYGTNKFWRDASNLQETGKWVEGYYCKTGENIKNKHDERVFFVPQGQTPIEAVVNDFEQLKKEWKRLVENYQEEHSDGKGGLENTPKDVPEWSRQIKGGKNEAKLENETLCYAKVKKNTAGKFEVLELFPVMISRRLHEVSPDSLLDESLKSASIIENVKNQNGTIKHNSEMSPADRVFGFVRHKRKDKDGKDMQFKGKIAGYCGQIRFGSVVCNGLLEKNADGKPFLNKDGKVIQDFDNLPLNILGQPKPQQGRFYVAEDDKGKAQTHQRNNEDAGYKKSEGRGLRGRKVYPHHNLPESYWITEKDWKSKEDTEPNRDLTQTLLDGKIFREYIRPKGEKRTDSQNRSIEGWIKPQTEFEFNIHFTNLSEVELGALVWLLDLPEKYFHRFGGGKPLGFGSVKLSIENSEITNGEDLKKFYGSLDETRNQSKTPEYCKAEFEKCANQVILNSFKAACKGFSTGLPIHYPRARRYSENYGVKTWLSPESPNPLPPHSEGLAYEWFVANNKTERSELKNAYVLKNIAEDNGLPILEHRK